MQQDQRIGLALAVLLIGACGAFFFRNETHERSQTPQLKNAQKLDDRIAQKTHHPYLKGIENVEAGGRSRVRTVADQAHDSDEDHAGSYWSPAEPSGTVRPRARMTDVENDVLELDPIPIPGQRSPNSVVQDTQSRSGSAGNGRKSDASETHIVQKGETLSSIAAKRLGNPGRFHELFEANQSQLKDANDLKVGMVLQIPDTRNGSSTPHSAGKPSLESTMAAGESVPSSVERRHAAPGRDIEEFSSPAKDGLIDSPFETSSNLKSTSESSPSKFVPARRFIPPSRPSGSRNGGQ